MALEKKFLSGVVEGFYGKPWSQAERFELFDWMSAWGMDTYLYAPKDDLKHRALWRQLYADEIDGMRALIQRSAERQIGFIYALAPGLDIGYSQKNELDSIFRRFAQMIELGCKHFALLFDDIPATMNAADAAQFGSFASAQAHVTNTVFRWTRERSPHARFLFCPTPYCGRMVFRQLGGANYLETIGRELLPEIDVLWTGPEIISRSIQANSIPEGILRRKPVIWDNLHANDYDRSRFYCGPYAGRDPQMRFRVNGILSNPNNEFPLNYVPLRTLAVFVQGEADWHPRSAFLKALVEWEARFGTIGERITFEQLRMFADCYYLPHEEGPEAQEFFGSAASAVAGRNDCLPTFQNGAASLREFCQRATELRDRSLFYALSQRIWDLREELDLLDRYVQFRYDPKSTGQFSSDFHLPKTYRGGLVRKLQSLLEQQSGETFVPRHHE